MRTVLRTLVETPGWNLPRHPGLAYDVWAPVEPTTGKIRDDQKQSWLEAVAMLSVDPDYAHAYSRLTAHLKAPGERWCEVELTSRLLIGHGNSAPTEVGLTLHHTWGVPLIPGTALKGLLSHYLDASCGRDRSSPTLPPRSPDLDHEAHARAAYEGITWRGNRIAHGPGEIHRAIFGAPSSEEDEKLAKLGIDVGETSGGVVFHDALYIPGSIQGDRPLALDVITPHQKPYYDSRGGSSPNDYSSPVPISFLTVRPGARFLVAVSGEPTWAQFALDELLAALHEWGVGAKTSSGYGRARDPEVLQAERAARKALNDVADPPVVPPAPQGRPALPPVQSSAAGELIREIARLPNDRVKDDIGGLAVRCLKQLTAHDDRQRVAAAIVQRAGREWIQGRVAKKPDLWGKILALVPDADKG